MTELAHRKSSNNALLADFANLSHDAVGNRLSLSASLPSSPTSYSGTTSYTYDNKEQLTQETSTRAGGYSNGYGYDLVGNPTTFKGVTQTFNSVNQNTQGGTIAFDSNGNPQTWNGAALTYNANDKLVSIGTVLSAGYGSDGLRAWKQSSAGRTYFLYDGLVPVCEVDGSGNVTAVNTVGANGLVARHMNGTGGGSVFYAFDPQGSVSVRLDTSGNVLSSHVNEAWGTQVSTGTGYASDPYAGYGGQWGYYRDVETGLHLLGHRYYDAAKGRFINRDPIGYDGGINIYGYCGNNPLTSADPLGTSWISIGTGVVVGIVVFVGTGFDPVTGVLAGGFAAGAVSTMEGNSLPEAGADAASAGLTVGELCSLNWEAVLPTLGIRGGMQSGFTAGGDMTRVRHHTDSGGLNGIRSGGEGYPPNYIWPNIAGGVGPGVYVEAPTPSFGPLSGKFGPGRFGAQQGAYVDFDCEAGRLIHDPIDGAD